MNNGNRVTSHWRSLCVAAGIDPAEVEMVSARFRAYRDYMASRGGGLSLAEWFRFYRLEKASEAPDQAGGVVSGCSATGEAAPQQLLRNPRGFFEVLEAHVNWDTPS
jgi:hypothetical protein